MIIVQSGEQGGPHPRAIVGGGVVREGERRVPVQVRLIVRHINSRDGKALCVVGPCPLGLNFAHEEASMYP